MQSQSVQGAPPKGPFYTTAVTPTKQTNHQLLQQYRFLHSLPQGLHSNMKGAVQKTMTNGLGHKM